MFCNTMSGLLLVVLLATTSPAQPATTLEAAIGDPAAERLAKPTPSQAEWHDTEFGMFIHFGLWSWPEGVSEEKTPLSHLKIFNPMNLDTDQWVDVAELMGANYVVFTAKHGDGFCMWQTDTSELSIKNTPWRDGQGDILADLAKSCRKRGMKLGVYIQGQDRWHNAGGGGRCATPQAQRRYNEIYRQQLTEVLSRYGTMFEVWFDGSLVVPVEDILEKYAPKAMVFQSPHTTIRWVGHEEGFAPYPAWNSVNSANASVQSGNSTARHGDPEGDVWLGLECDARIRASWMYQADNVHTLKSVDYLMDMYYRSVGHGAVLLLNHTPDPTGLIPDTDVKRAKEFGDEIRRRFDNSLAETTGFGDIVELSLAEPTTVDHVVTMEDILHGERVREYVIEGFAGDAWRKLAEGISIGHKKIDSFEPIKVSKLRVRVVKSAATPLIRRLAVYHTQP